MRNKQKMISAAVFVHNDEGQIGEAVDSAKLLTDDVIVIDIESTDNTADHARRSGARIYSFPFTAYVEPAREFGIQKANADWILVLDSDERVTKQLANEIKSVVKNLQFTHYKIPRKNIFGAKKWLKHGGWWPDYQIRLINKNYFKKWPEEIHSTPQVTGSCGMLKEPLIHYFHGDFEKMVEKTALFEDIESRLLLKAGRNASPTIFLRKFFGELYRRLLRHRGFLDGPIGIIEAIYQAFSKTITYLFLYERKSVFQKKKGRTL